MYSASILLLAETALSAGGGQWSRRAYYSDLECKGNFVAGINVAIAVASCAQTQSTPLNTTCNFKSRVENGITSSEASGCATAATFSDQTWIPSAQEGTLVPGASYMTVNQYLSADCTPSSIYEQADGKCHAIEFSKSFYKAVCGSSQMIMTVCDDRDCAQCTSSSSLQAGTFVDSSFSVDGNKCTTIKGQTVKVVCADLSLSGSGSSGSSPPTTSSPSTTSPKNSADSFTAFEVISSAIASLALLFA